MSKDFLDIQLPDPKKLFEIFFEKPDKKLDFIWKNLISLLPVQDNLNPEITYSLVIEYFVTERPEDTRVKKGAVLRENHSQGYLITQVFLDNKNKLVCDTNDRPYGRRIIAKKIDEELQNNFGNQNLIIVE